MLTEQFAELFAGRFDAHGSDDGGCVREPPNYAAHLSGERAQGVYPMVHRIAIPNTYSPEWQVKWGCVDFDIKSEAHRSWDYESEGEAHLAAVNLQKVCRHLGITAWIERTRSSGRHVWIFASTWVPASTMRRALLLACSVAGVSSREVNPKQTTLSEGQLGNYVRLPFPGALSDNKHDAQVVIEHWHRNMFAPNGQYFVYGPTVGEFVERALAARTSPQTLEAIAAKWRAPEPVRSVAWSQSEAIARILDIALIDVEDLLHRLNRAGRSVFENGPNDGDRSRGLSYLARQARNSGLTPSQALTLLAAAPWQKFRGRHDEEQRLREIVQYAYND